MLEEAELKSLELRTSFAHTNILILVVTLQELVTLHYTLMICEQESIITSPVYRLGLSLYFIDCEGSCLLVVTEGEGSR